VAGLPHFLGHLDHEALTIGQGRPIGERQQATGGVGIGEGIGEEIIRFNI
jgi:hypothetical protein